MSLFKKEDIETCLREDVQTDNWCFWGGYAERRDGGLTVQGEGVQEDDIPK